MSKTTFKAHDFPLIALTEVAPIYWIAGDEPLGQIEAVDHLRQALRAQGFEERVIFEGNAKADWQSVIFNAQERSMFSSRKWIEIKLTSLKLGKSGQAGFDQLVQLANSSEVVMIITSERLDATAKKMAAYTWVQTHGALIESNPIAAEHLPAWLTTRLKRHQLSASPEALTWLTHHLEGNLLAADQEIKKLALLHPNQKLELDMVQESVAQLAKHDLESLIISIMKGQPERVAIALDTLESEGEAPPRLVWVLYDLLRGLRGVCDGLAQRGSISTLARQFRFWGAKEAALGAIIARFPKDSQKQQLAFGRLLLRCAQLDALGKGLDDRSTSGEFWQEARRFCLSLSGVKILKGLGS